MSKLRKNVVYNNKTTVALMGNIFDIRRWFFIIIFYYCSRLLVVRSLRRPSNSLKILTPHNGILRALNPRKRRDVCRERCTIKTNQTPKSIHLDRYTRVAFNGHGLTCNGEIITINLGRLFRIIATDSKSKSEKSVAQRPTVECFECTDSNRICRNNIFFFFFNQIFKNT